MNNFEPLTERDVEVRVALCKDNGLQLLLYKNSRVDMRTLDETYGPENWQCKFYECKGTLFCSIGIRIPAIPEGEWVWKDNAGAPSNMEAEKGEASDAFKRAGFTWGIGRELYTAPFIWVPSDQCNIRQQNGKWRCFDRFEVTRIDVEDGQIVGLEIKNSSNGKIAFAMGAKVKKAIRASSKERNEAVTEFIAVRGKYCDNHNADFDELKAGIKKRPDFEDTADYYRKLVKEFSK